MSNRPGPTVGPLAPSAPFDAVVIAASFGGMTALQAILERLPRDFPAAILIQTHLAPEGPSILAEILQRATTLPVGWARHLAVLRPGTVIVAPPGQHVAVLPDGTQLLTGWKARSSQKPRADGLFTTVAASFGPRAIGVVLTGYLDDGARGAQAISLGGGRVLAQDPATAACGDMPQAAIATGCVDYVLSLEAMPAALISLTMVAGASRFFAVPGGPLQPYRAALRAWGR
jgi:two-component system chemotaxis response regulator CheB